MDCPACGRTVPAGFRFCGHCGHALPEASTAPPTTTPEQRRQLTVMFCDLAGSTALAERLDPEELRDVVRRYQTACGDEVTRFGGHVAQYLGDGLLVYFGYPEAHEDDTRRAILAGLNVLQAMARLNEDLAERDLTLAVRIGVHTGPVVTGEIGARREALALGPTPNIAARLQDAAAPGTIVVSAAAYRLVEHHFRWESLGARPLKGLSQPVEAFRVLGERRARGVLLSASDRDLSPPVGRSAEIDRMLAMLQETEAGASRTIMVSGDPGIGKSRMLQFLHDRTGDEKRTWLVCRCSPFETNTAFAPIAELTAAWLQLERDDAPTSQLETLRAGLVTLDVRDESSIALLAGLLALPVDETSELAAMSPARRKARLIEVLLDLLMRSAARRPVVLAVEDLHWADPSTLELLGTLAAGVGSRLLLVLTFRSMFKPPWPAAPGMLSVCLERLGEEETKALMQSVTGGRRLPPEVVREIVSKTDGVPLFVEELTKMVLESGLLRDTGSEYQLAGPLPALAIPATLQDSLTARLDRLSSARELAQLGAVIGREFSLEMLEAVSGRTASSLAPELERLVDAELLFRQGVGPTTSFIFKHALIQDAAYSSLLKSTRHRLHQHVAQVLSTRFPALAEQRPQLLAHHYTEAGLGEDAIPLWLKAGHRALGRAENLEALQYLSKARALVDALPPSRARDEREIGILSALGLALTSAKGYAAPEANQVYARAQELADRLGDTPSLFWTIWGFGVYHFVRADFRVRTDRQLKRIAEASGDPALLIEAGFSEGSYEFYGGYPAKARAHFERGLTFDDPSRYRNRIPPTGVDPGVTNLSFLAMSHWLTGDGAAAEERAREVIERARSVGHRFSLAFALIHVGFLNQMRREPSLVLPVVEEGLAISEQSGFPIFIPEAHSMLGWAQTCATGPGQEGEVAAGIARMRGCLDLWRSYGLAVWQTHFLAHLAEALTAVGRLDEAAAAVDDGLECAERTGEGLCEPDLYRLRALIHLQATEANAENAITETAAAERALTQALSLARERGTLLFELRAAVALADLRRRQGRADEGRAEVRAVRSRFAAVPPGEDLREAASVSHA